MDRMKQIRFIDFLMLLLSLSITVVLLSNLVFAPELVKSNPIIFTLALTFSILGFIANLFKILPNLNYD
jgi:hypothetical protein